MSEYVVTISKFDKEQIRIECSGDDVITLNGIEVKVEEIQGISLHNTNNDPRNFFHHNKGNREL